MNNPHHSLNTVKMLIEDCWFSAPSKSLHAVIAVHRELTMEAAAIYIKTALYQLENHHYAHSVVMWDNVADIYGMNYRGNPWYIKFFIENNCLEEISFHPPYTNLRTMGGIIKQGDYKYDEIKKMWRMRQ